MAKGSEKKNMLSKDKEMIGRKWLQNGPRDLRDRKICNESTPLRTAQFRNMLVQRFAMQELQDDSVHTMLLMGWELGGGA